MIKALKLRLKALLTNLFMEEIVEYFKNRKNLAGLLILGLLVFGIVITVILVGVQQIFKSRATGDPIVFGGPNAQQRSNGTWTTTSSQIKFQITSPLGPPPPAGGPSPTPLPSSSPTSCANKFIFGLNGPVNPKLKELYTRPSLRFIAISWGGIQTNADSPYDFSSMDNQINGAIADGQTPSVKFCDGDCFPNWARQMDREVDHSYCCSTDYVCRVLKEDSGTIQAFKNVVTAMVARYKDSVTQWDYGIEPNCRGYSPGRYTSLLKAFNEAVRVADPQAVVIGGHISGPNTDYLSGMYANGAGPYFDRLSVDPYGQPFDYSGLENIRNVMVSQGDSNKKIWIGEWGVPTNNDEARQASLIEEVLNYMVTKPWIEAAFYHNFECELWTDTCSPGSPGYLGFGLLHSDGTPKAAFDAFKRQVNACGG